MARASKRVGFGPNKGAINAKITQGVVKPNNPIIKDLHIDFTRGMISSFDGNAWIDLRLIYSGPTEPPNKDWLWYDTTNYALKYYSGGSWH